jgi:hypothetical protein
MNLVQPIGDPHELDLKIRSLHVHSIDTVLTPQYLRLKTILKK